MNYNWLFQTHFEKIDRNTQDFKEVHRIVINIAETKPSFDMLKLDTVELITIYLQDGIYMLIKAEQRIDYKK